MLLQPWLCRQCGCLTHCAGSGDSTCIPVLHRHHQSQWELLDTTFFILRTSLGFLILLLQ